MNFSHDEAYLFFLFLFINLFIFDRCPAEQVLLTYHLSDFTLVCLCENEVMSRRNHHFIGFNHYSGE